MCISPVILNLDLVSHPHSTQSHPHSPGPRESARPLLNFSFVHFTRFDPNIFRVIHLKSVGHSLFILKYEQA